MCHTIYSLQIKEKYEKSREYKRKVFKTSCEIDHILTSYMQCPQCSQPTKSLLVKHETGQNQFNIQQNRLHFFCCAPYLHGSGDEGDLCP